MGGEDRGPGADHRAAAGEGDAQRRPDGDRQAAQQGGPDEAEEVLEGRQLRAVEAAAAQDRAGDERLDRRSRARTGARPGGRARR